MRILITGSRDWTDREAIADALTHWWAVQGQVTLVSGGAKGADRLAEDVAREFGWEVECHPADWETYGKSAGHRRNAEMVAAGADVCLAFAMPCTKEECQGKTPHDSHGTWHCSTTAARAGITTVWYRKPREEE